MAGYHAVREAMERAHAKTGLLRQVVRDREERMRGMRETNDVRKMYIGDRIRNAAKIGDLTGELFSLAAAEIERLRAENASLRQRVTELEATEEALWPLRNK